MTSNRPTENDLPTLEDMRDTLTFMWDHFFQEMIDEWLKAPGSGYKTTWHNARVQMRYRTLTDQAGGTSDFVELKITAQDGSFSAQGTFVSGKHAPPCCMHDEAVETILMRRIVR